MTIRNTNEKVEMAVVCTTKTERAANKQQESDKLVDVGEQYKDMDSTDRTHNSDDDDYSSVGSHDVVKDVRIRQRYQCYWRIASMILVIAVSTALVYATLLWLQIQQEQDAVTSDSAAISTVPYVVPATAAPVVVSTIMVPVVVSITTTPVVTTTAPVINTIGPAATANPLGSMETATVALPINNMQTGNSKTAVPAQTTIRPPYLHQPNQPTTVSSSSPLTENNSIQFHKVPQTVHGNGTTKKPTPLTTAASTAPGVYDIGRLPLGAGTLPVLTNTLPNPHPSHERTTAKPAAYSSATAKTTAAPTTTPEPAPLLRGTVTATPAAVAEPVTSSTQAPTETATETSWWSKFFGGGHI